MTSSRKHILEYLQRYSPASATEISRVLGTSAANVRHHLSVLVEFGVVEVISTRSPHGRGRPSKLYGLTSQIHEHNLGGLARTSLDMLLSGNPDDEKLELLRKLATKLGAGLKSASLPSSLGQRYTQAVQQLNRLGYKARWEAHSQAPHLVLGHCPYADIIADHPELCQMDTYLLEHLTDVEVEQIKKRVLDAHGSRFCLFLPKKA